MSPKTRRQLRFSSLDDAVADAKHLLSVGYHATGNWNLAQTLGHCNDWLSFPMDGYPRAALPIRIILWLLRSTIGPSVRKKILRSGRMKAGGPTMPQTVKSASQSEDEAAVETLAQTVARTNHFQGPLHSSPVFGKMSRDEVIQLQMIHLQHHLSFLVPK